MEYRLRESILNLYKNSYAKENNEPEDLSNFTDCSSGINPFGFSEGVKRALQAIPLEIINLYPESCVGLKKAIAEYWKDQIDLKYDNILFGSGSIDIIYKINKLFLDNKSKVLGYSPQFSDYIDDVKSYDGIYDYYLMTIENNYKFDPELFLEKMSNKYKLIYIDNPNNPTGQVIPISSIEAIVKRAQELGICAIIDEAYGDFMDNANSAVSLINDYNNIFVIRTFSKGLGLAGVRGGYLVTSDNLADYYNKVSNPYSMNGLAEHLAVAALKDVRFIKDSMKRAKEIKTRLIDSLHKVKVLETDLNVPIMTIKHPCPEVNLEGLLRSYNILAISGEGFIGLDESFVRLRINPDIEPVINAFSQIEKSI
ncbi:MAG: histidinol-phosphate transaminase [Clostridiaceae bacterium]|nr:histidinol-phosphate transaminase [Clostridiaceae bacterium]